MEQEGVLEGDGASTAGRSGCSGSAASGRRSRGARRRSGWTSSIWSRRFDAASLPADLAVFGLDASSRVVACRPSRASPQEVAERPTSSASTWRSRPDTKGLVSADVLGRLKPGRHLRQHGARRGRRPRRARGGRPRARPARRARRLPERAGGRHRGVQRPAAAGCPGVYGTHHIGASTEQAQEAIAAETVRIVRSFKDTGQVPNVVNLARRTPATHRLVVRHRDRPRRPRARVRPPARGAASTCRRRRTSSSRARRPPLPASTSTARRPTSREAHRVGQRRHHQRAGGRI